MPQINKPNQYFNTKLYTGNGNSSHAITGVGFQPDWVWIKDRDSAVNHLLHDSIRGVTNLLVSNTTAGDDVNTNILKSFDTDGFTVGSNSASNGSGTSFVSWNWLASNTTASNTDGSITSTVSANTTSGFSIVSYSGNGTNGATVGHGLGVAPKAIILKARTTGTTQNWFVNYPFGTGNGYILLNSTSAGDGANSTVWNSTAPNTSTVTLGTSNGVNNATYDYIMYCFAEKKGFSKFGSYTGNGSTDGTFVYTGFKPAFVIRKNTDSTASWFLHDNKRDGYNVTKNWFSPNDSDAEETSLTLLSIDFLSNGFKMRSDNSNGNGSGTNYIYMAFAESPLVGTNNTPATAR